MGTETIPVERWQFTRIIKAVKLNNPLMGTETHHLFKR